MHYSILIFQGIPENGVHQCSAHAFEGGADIFLMPPVDTMYVVVFHGVIEVDGGKSAFIDQPAFYNKGECEQSRTDVFDDEAEFAGLYFQSGFFPDLSFGASVHVFVAGFEAASGKRPMQYPLAVFLANEQEFVAPAYETCYPDSLVHDVLDLEVREQFFWGNSFVGL